MIPIIIATVSGLLIELFFQLVKYKDDLNNSPKGITSYGVASDASNYMSVTQYLSGGNRKWINYFLFRALPPTIIFILLSGVLARYFGLHSVTCLLVLSAVVSLIPRDINHSFIKSQYISEKLIHIANILLILICAYLIGLISSLYDLAFIAPSISGMFDNLWSSLAIAMLVLFYLRITNLGSDKKYRDQIAEKNAHDNYILRSYKEINSKFANDIKESCKTNNCSIFLLYAVLIYESMNRPSIIRSIENAVVRLTKLKLSVGIAQIQSKKPLSDTESILKASSILKNSAQLDVKKYADEVRSDELKKVLVAYNKGSNYAESIDDIITTLYYFVPTLNS